MIGGGFRCLLASSCVKGQHHFVRMCTSEPEPGRVNVQGKLIQFAGGLIGFGSLKVAGAYGIQTLFTRYEIMTAERLLLSRRTTATLSPGLTPNSDSP